MKVSSNIWNRKLPTTNWLTTNGAVTKKKFGRCLLYYFIRLPLFLFAFFRPPQNKHPVDLVKFLCQSHKFLSGMLDSPKIMFLNLALKNNLSFVLSLFKHVFIAPNEFVPGSRGTEHSQLGAQARSRSLKVDVS